MTMMTFVEFSNKVVVGVRVRCEEHDSRVRYVSPDGCILLLGWNVMFPLNQLYGKYLAGEFVVKPH